MPIEIYGTSVPTWDEFIALATLVQNDHYHLQQVIDELAWWRVNFNTRCWSVIESYVIKNIFPRIEYLEEAYLHLVDWINSIALDIYRIEQMVVELMEILGLLPDELEALSRRVEGISEDLASLERYASLVLDAWGVGKKSIVEELIEKMEEKTGIRLDYSLPTWIREALEKAEEVTR